MRNKWTKLAIDCYNLGCWCSKCNLLPEYIKKHCKVKQTVLRLVREVGRPNEESTKHLRNF